MPEVIFSGLIGLIIVGVAIALVIAAIFMPFFVWGIYNQSKRQNQILCDIQNQNAAAYEAQDRAMRAILEANNQQIRILWDDKNQAA